MFIILFPFLRKHKSQYLIHETKKNVKAKYTQKTPQSPNNNLEDTLVNQGSGFRLVSP